MPSAEAGHSGAADWLLSGGAFFREGPGRRRLAPGTGTLPGLGGLHLGGACRWVPGSPPPPAEAMDEDGLPLMGSGIDLTKVPAIQQKRTVAFLNQFVVHTVQFLNRFSTVCEEKLADLSLRIQQIETTLNILDAKLSSIPGLDDVTIEASPVSITNVTNGSHSEPTSEQPQQNSTQDSGPQESEVSSDNILTVAKDPRYARYLKMVQVGVPVMAIRNKMISEGLDPDLLEKPDAPVPDGESEKNVEESSDSESSFSD